MLHTGIESEYRGGPGTLVVTIYHESVHPGSVSHFYEYFRTEVYWNVYVFEYTFTNVRVHNYTNMSKLKIPDKQLGHGEFKNA